MKIEKVKRQLNIITDRVNELNATITEHPVTTIDELDNLCSELGEVVEYIEGDLFTSVLNAPKETRLMVSELHTKANNLVPLVDDLYPEPEYTEEELMSIERASIEASVHPYYLS